MTNLIRCSTFLSASSNFSILYLAIFSNSIKSIAKIANHYFLPCFASILHTFREVFCEDSAKPDNFVSFEKLLQNKHHRIDIELFEIKIKCLDQILSIPYKNFDVLMIKNLNELFQLAFDYAFTQMPSIDIKCEPWQVICITFCLIFLTITMSFFFILRVC